MKLWGWWRKDNPAAKTSEVAPAKDDSPQFLEDREPKFDDNVETAAALRKAANPGIIETAKKITIEDFKNINSIPCFRQAIMTGVGIGGVTGLVLIISRRPSNAANWAMGGFLLGSVVSWEQCRFRMREGKKSMQKARDVYRHKENEE